MRNWCLATFTLLLASIVYLWVPLDQPTLPSAAGICKGLFQAHRAMAQSTAPAGPAFLTDRHTAEGMGCMGCHDTDTPGKGAFAETDTCLKCHEGSYDKLAELNGSLGPRNPHDAHVGQLDCINCHHSHEASELYCEQCHSDLGLKTP
jgi:hypothetical protein